MEPHRNVHRSECWFVGAPNSTPPSVIEITYYFQGIDLREEGKGEGKREMKINREKKCFLPSA
jgi:hypothetical protein